MKNKNLKLKKIFKRIVVSKPQTNEYKIKAVRGFTLLFASLIGSLVFTIGIAILNISLKQMSLSKAGRESQQAFYSADTGIECALFLDRGAGDPDCQAGFFGIASSTVASGIEVCGKDSIDYDDNPSPAQKCFGQQINEINRNQGINSVINTFDVRDNTDTDVCFSVTVTKRPNPNNPTDPSDMQSVIESRGYSTCNEDGQVFERAIKTLNY